MIFTPEYNITIVRFFSLCIFIKEQLLERYDVFCLFDLFRLFQNNNHNNIFNANYSVVLNKL